MDLDPVIMPVMDMARGKDKDTFRAK